jgi:hypothetical protein
MIRLIRYDYIPKRYVHLCVHTFSPYPTGIGITFLNHVHGGVLFSVDQAIDSVLISVLYTS